MNKGGWERKRGREMKRTKAREGGELWRTLSAADLAVDQRWDWLDLVGLLVLTLPNCIVPRVV